MSKKTTKTPVVETPKFTTKVFRLFETPELFFASKEEMEKSGMFAVIETGTFADRYQSITGFSAIPIFNLKEKFADAVEINPGPVAKTPVPPVYKDKEDKECAGCAS
jgi:hypothetical protein